MVNKEDSALPFVSIIVPSLNQGVFIEQTLHSLVEQGYPRLEIIVCDGLSTDNTIDTLERWSNHITWISERDSGQSEAINKGLRKAQGEILGFLNADDFLLPGALYSIGRAFLQNPETVWVSGQCHIVDSHGRRIRGGIEKYKNFFLKHSLSLNALYVTNFISQPATFWHRLVWEKVGGFDPLLRYVMDYDYWIRIWKTFGPPRIIHHPLAAFRVHPKSKTTSEGHSLRYEQEEESVLRRHHVPQVWKLLHRVHRLGMTVSYRWMNTRQTDSGKK